MHNINLQVAEQLVGKDVEESGEALDMVRAFKIESHGDLQSAVRWVGAVKSSFAEIEEKRKTFTAPLRKVVDELNDFFGRATNALGVAEEELKAKIVTYVHDCLAARDEELLKVNETEDLREKQEAIVRAEQAIPPKIPGLSIREEWGGDIEDPKLLMEWILREGRHELVEINKKALRDMTKNAHGNLEIPGWKPLKKRIPAITPSRIK